MEILQHHSDWALGTGWSIGEGKARKISCYIFIGFQYSQVYFLDLTSTFRISFDVESSVGSVRARLGQTNLNYVGQGTHTFYAIPSGLRPT